MRDVDERVRRRERGIAGEDIDDGFELIDVGQTPVAGDGPVREAARARGERVRVLQGGVPDFGAEAAGVLQPDETSQFIGYGAVSIVGKARRPWTAFSRCEIGGGAERRIAAVIGDEVDSS